MNETVASSHLTHPPTDAEIYDRDFVPSLFARWGPTVCEMAGIGPGHRVLDVATGTGVLARAAVGRVGPKGSVEGVDPNVEMLAVARRKPEPVTWVEGRAEALPQADASFDRVVSQFGMMFFSDPVAALVEAQRVLRPGGRLAFAVCGPLDWSPGYSVLVELLHRRFGASVAEAFRAPFNLGDQDRLAELASRADLPEPAIHVRSGWVRFASIQALVAAERACAWTLGGILDDEQFNDLRLEAEASLKPFTVEGGRVQFDMPALVLTAQRPSP